MRKRIGASMMPISRVRWEANAVKGDTAYFPASRPCTEEDGAAGLHGAKL
jgi:hypothetical protein